MIRDDVFAVCVTSVHVLKLLYNIERGSLQEAGRAVENPTPHKNSSVG